MYLLDTNVISEFRKIRKNQANQNVVNWLKSTQPHQLYTSIIVMIELERWGLLKARKDPIQGQQLHDWYQNVVQTSFKERVLMIDEAVAAVCAHLHVPNPKPEHDALIAATAIAHNLILVTRNTQDFKDMDNIKLLNPFDFQAA